MTDHPPPLPPPIPTALVPPPLPNPHGPRQYAPPIGATDLSVGDTLSEGWQVFTTNYGMLLGASLLTMGASIVAGFIPILGAFASFFITFPMIAGLIMLSVRLARGPTPEFNDLFNGFKRYWPVMGACALKTACLLIPLIILAPGVIGLIVSIVALATGTTYTGFAIGGIVVSALVMLLGYAVMMVISLRLILVEAICLDPQAGLPGAIDCLKASWMLTRPVIWPLVGIAFCMFGISLLCMILLFLPLYFVAVPLWYAVIGVIYKRIVGDLDPLVCRWCAYDLRGTTAPLCPECGSPRPA